MTTFQPGDRVRRTRSPLLGSEWTVSEYKDSGRGQIAIDGVQGWFAASNYELVQPSGVIAPEDVRPGSTIRVEFEVEAQYAQVGHERLFIARDHTTGLYVPLDAKITEVKPPPPSLEERVADIMQSWAGHDGVDLTDAVKRILAEVRGDA